MLGSAASGSLAGQLIFSSSKGRAYLKRHKKPKQPDTAGQVAMRAMMAFLSQKWKTLNQAQQDTWAEEAHKHNLAPFNIFQRENLQRWRNYLAPSRVHPAPMGGNTGSISTQTILPHVRSFTVRWRVVTLADIWAMALFLVPASGAPTLWSNLLHVTPITSTGYYTQLISPYAAGTYWIAEKRLLWTGYKPATSAYRCVTVTDS